MLFRLCLIGAGKITGVFFEYAGKVAQIIKATSQGRFFYGVAAVAQKFFGNLTA